VACRRLAIDRQVWNTKALYSSHSDSRHPPYAATYPIPVANLLLISLVINVDQSIPHIHLLSEFSDFVHALIELDLAWSLAFTIFTCFGLLLVDASISLAASCFQKASRFSPCKIGSFHCVDHLLSFSRICFGYFVDYLRGSHS
jgi:hypothetical protein